MHKINFVAAPLVVFLVIRLLADGTTAADPVEVLLVWSKATHVGSVEPEVTTHKSHGKIPTIFHHQFKRRED